MIDESLSNYSIMLPKTSFYPLIWIADACFCFHF